MYGLWLTSIRREDAMLHIFGVFDDLAAAPWPIEVARIAHGAWNATLSPRDGTRVRTCKSCGKGVLSSRHLSGRDHFVNSNHR